MRTRSVITAFLTVVISLCLVLVVLEAGMRICNPQEYFSVCVNQWDPHVGTKHIPGIEGFVVCPEYSIDLVINSKGLRDREYTYEKIPGTRRIVVLGDSYACGYGVQAEETFAKVLDAILADSASATDRWEVINAGIGSTGTANQLALFETEVCRYSPDLVVLCFCPANDFWDNVISGLYTLEDGKLVKHEAPYTGPRRIQKIVNLIPGYTTFFARSHLLNFIRYRIAALHTNRLVARVQKPEERSETVRKHNELTKRLISALSSACTQRSCTLAVMIIPPPPAGELPAWTADLIEHCRGEGIPCLDLAQAFQKHGESPGQISYPRDGHWNSKGHAAAARELYDFLVTRSLIAPGRPARPLP